MWQTDLMRKCMEHNIQPIINDDKLVFVCAAKPSRRIQEQLKAYLPDPGQSEFIEHVKPQTIEKISELLKGTDVRNLNVKEESGRKMTFRIACEEESSIPFGDFNDLIIKDGFLDEWTIEAGNDTTTYNKKVMQALKSNCCKDTGIQEDDILNLRILLESSDTVEDFIKSI
jgi:hypothetical protein